MNGSSCLRTVITTRDEVVHAVSVLERYRVNEGGSSQATFLFDAEGRARGLKEFHLAKRETDTEIVFRNNYAGKREAAWSYWFTDGKARPYVTDPAMLETGEPRFAKTADKGAVPVPSDLLALDLAFIPGTQSCFRSVYAMGVATGDQQRNGGGVGREPFTDERREELLDGPLAAGHRLHVRTTGHSLFVTAHEGGDTYVVVDPGRNPLGKVGTPEGRFTYAGGTLTRSDGKKSYPILEVQRVG
ncbi:MAG: hypothetical protein KC635_05570 [Myxococcales bacterium]|nr:hypothetical protein [Myxococcales bacterium]